MKPRIIKLGGGPSNTEVTVVAEVFDDRFSNANCTGDEGEEFESSGESSNFKGRGRARRHNRKQRRLDRRMKKYCNKYPNDPECNPQQAAPTDDGSSDQAAPADDSQDQSAAPDTGAGADMGGGDDGSQDAMDAINDRDNAMPDDSGSGGAGMDDGGGSDQDAGDGMDDGGGSDQGAGDGMDDGDNEAMGQDGGDDNEPAPKHKKHHKRAQVQDEDSTSDEDEMDESSEDEGGSNDIGDIEDSGDISEGEDFFEGKSNASGSKKKLAVIKKAYLKNGANKLLAMAHAAGVTPPSLGGDQAKWDAFTKKALRAITPLKVILKKKGMSKFTGQGKVMRETANESANEVTEKYLTDHLAFEGDVGEFAFTPMGYEENVDLFSSEPLSEAAGSTYARGRKGAGRMKGGKRRVVYTTGVPKDDLRTPLVVKKGNATVIASRLKPTIGKNYIDIPPRMSNFSGDNSQTGLVGLDDISDYDAPGIDYYFLGADGTGKVMKANIAPIAIMSALAIGLVIWGVHMKNSLE